MACLYVIAAAGADDAAEAVSGSGRGPTATSSPSPSPSAGTSETLTTTVVSDVTAHRGSVARVRYRADDTAGGAVTLDLLVTTRSGEVRRRLVTGRLTQAGVERVWRGRLRLPRGLYLLVARAVDASGRREASARAAALRVLASLPPLVPTASARRAAFAWAARRAGKVAVAVVDSHGRSYGYHEDRRFITASVVKAMLLVAYLRRHSTVSPAMHATLTRMIIVSDNDAADAVYRSVRRSGLRRLARQARMRSFRTSGAWILCRVSAADMARFFRDMERYIPRAHRRFANGLLTHIVSYQSWGIPEAARPLGYRVYSKAGWLGSWTLANQAARLERKRVRIGLAVLTDDNPTPAYGKETVAGITKRLLRR
jgi:beta-lactamase class A